MYSRTHVRLFSERRHFFLARSVPSSASTSPADIAARGRCPRDGADFRLISSLELHFSMEESSSYRAGLGLVNARLHSYAWIMVLPAAAECTASVYYPSISLGGLDLQLAVLNVSAAARGLLCGVGEWRGRRHWPARRPLRIHRRRRAYSFLSTYTSWAGMVGLLRPSPRRWSTHMLGCIICGMVAHVGRRSRSPSLKQAEARQEDALGHLLRPLFSLLSSDLLCRPIASRSTWWKDRAIDHDAPTLPALINYLEAQEHRRAKRVLFDRGRRVHERGQSMRRSASIWGVDVPRGTLVCNGLCVLLAMPQLRRRCHSVRQRSFGGMYPSSLCAGHSRMPRSPLAKGRRDGPVLREYGRAAIIRDRASRTARAPPATVDGASAELCRKASLAERASLSPKPLSPLGAAFRSGKS